MPDALDVWLDDPTFGPVTHLGRLHRTDLERVRFAYAPKWLKNPAAFALDPALALAGGSFHPKDSNFGIFMHSCPDRWGQTLMKRREVVEARQQARARRTLRPWDFFLGVREAQGRRLAPAYDMNPSFKLDSHVLAPDDAGAESDLGTVVASAGLYRVSADQAQADLAFLRQVLATWQTKAKLLGLSAEDRAELRDCFLV